MSTRRGAFVLAALWLLGGCAGSCGGPHHGAELRLATTTSAEASGILDVLLPAFEKESGYDVEVTAVPTARALELLGSGQADAAITDSPEEQKRAMAADRAGTRTPVMHDDLVLVGPAAGARTVAGAADAAEATRRIAAHQKVLIARDEPDALERASDEEAFTLADRAAFMAHREDLDLAIVFQGDPSLRNDYAVMEPHVTVQANRAGARALREFLCSDAGKAIIGGFGIEAFGEPAFIPD